MRHGGLFLKMYLFTIIALMISIFGAAYSAIAALRSHYENKIRSNKDLADRTMREINAKDRNSPTITTIRNHYQKLQFASDWWNRLNLVPIIIFCITTLTLVFFVLYLPADTKYEDHWKIFKTAIGGILIIDIFCIVTVYCLYHKFRINNDSFHNLIIAFDEQSAQSAISKPR
jgi:hypothetical protein